MPHEPENATSAVRPPGSPFPLGATSTPEGLNLAVRAPSAELVEACLFLGDEEVRVPLEARSHGVHHGFLPGVAVGTQYGLRAHGPWEPGRGLRFNPAKLLVDPYARAIVGDVTSPEVPRPGTPGDPTQPDPRDSAPFVPRGVVVGNGFDWGDDAPPATPWAETVLYEMHVKGFTAAHPGVPEHLRGTYAGLAHPAAIEHLVRLGVTAVELLPVHHSVPEPPLAARNTTNYWGYSSLGFFAPHAGYAADRAPGAQVGEFKSMVRALHAAGIEVILDVVYNHTAEGNDRGPTLSLRGLDNQAYYRLVEGDQGHYYDTTGTGNSLLMRSPHVLQLIMDSLRYWVLDMHVDGFRFDLAATLARQFHEVDRLSAFFDLVQQDPVISQVKLIAEPWDLGDGGYQVGAFPALWTEWNGKYRDTVRDFWRGEHAALPEFASRLTGSADLYESSGRRPFASVNFVTAHDGFTLRDLVSYDHKHNEANGEDNRDGTGNNRSWNHGVEGPTDDAAVVEGRLATMRALLATLLLSTGTPMLVMGDESGRTQHGNNNPYNQDNEISWMGWVLEPWQEDLLAWTTAILDVRRNHPALRQTEFFDGRPVAEGRPADLAWLSPDGSPMTDGQWQDPATGTLVMALSGELFTRDDEGHPMRDAAFLVVLNRAHDAVEVALPMTPYGDVYRRLLDTALPRPDAAIVTHPAASTTPVAARSVTLFRVEHEV